MLLAASGFRRLTAIHGQGDAQGSGLAPVELDERGVLHRGAPGSTDTLRFAGDFQYRSGFAVHGTRFTEVLEEHQNRINRDGRGRWLDNVFIERLWWSLKYECVYLHAFETGSDLHVGLANWIRSQKRQHNKNAHVHHGHAHQRSIRA